VAKLEILNKRISAQVTMLWRYKLDVFGGQVSISADGSIIAVGTEDLNLKVKDCDTVYFMDREGKLLSSSRTKGDVNAVSVSADGSLTAVGSEYGDVRALDKKGELLWRFFGRGYVSCISVSGDGSIITAGTRDGILYVLGGTGRLLREYPMGDTVRSVSVSGDGSTIMCGFGGKVTIIDRKGELLTIMDRKGKSLREHSVGGCIQSVSASASGSILAAGSDNGKVRLFRPRSNQLLVDQLGGCETRGGVTAVSVCNDGGLIAAGTSDGEVYVLNEKAEVLWKYRGPGSTRVLSLSASGSIMIFGSGNTIFMFTKDGESVGVYETDDDIKSVSVSGDGSLLAAANYHGEVYLFRHLTPEAEERIRTEQLKAEIIGTIEDALKDT
jgi:WD40 repeat protein